MHHRRPCCFYLLVLLAAASAAAASVPPGAAQSAQSGQSTDLSQNTQSRQAAKPTAEAQQSSTQGVQPAAAAPAAASSAPASPSSPAAAPTSPTAAQAAAALPVSGTIEVPSGTKLPLVLHNAVTTRNAQPGDPLYLETLFPIVLNNKILIPAGSFVEGEILETKRPGRTKGRGEMRIKLDTMILPNGYTVNFNAVPSNAGTGGNESTDKEGNIHGDTDKTTDAGTIIKGTAIGAGVGGVATRTAGGAAIGAGAGALVGLTAVLLTRGPELELPRGTTFDVELIRPLLLDASQIHFTDPGHASTLPGPPNREPVRSRSPF